MISEDVFEIGFEGLKVGFDMLTRLFVGTYSTYGKFGRQALNLLV
jgi:hypothetical protein